MKTFKSHFIFITLLFPIACALCQDDTIAFQKQNGVKNMIFFSALLDKYGTGGNIAYFKFPYNSAFVHIGPIYEVEFLQLEKSDTVKLSEFGFGGAIGILASGPTNPLSLLLDAKLSFGTSFGSTIIFSIGIGSSQLILLRFGGNFRFVVGGGIFENVRSSEIFPFDWGCRVGLGFEFSSSND